MRHRIMNEICLGRPNGTDFELDNNWKGTPNPFRLLISEMSIEALKTFKPLENYGQLDFGFNLAEGLIAIGIEPTYQFDDLFIIVFDLKDKQDCKIITGKSFASWGNGIKKRTKFYKDYNRQGKFVKFIDKWYDRF